MIRNNNAMRASHRKKKVRRADIRDGKSSSKVTPSPGVRGEKPDSQSSPADLVATFAQNPSDCNDYEAVHTSPTGDSLNQLDTKLSPNTGTKNLDAFRKKNSDRPVTIDGICVHPWFRQQISMPTTAPRVSPASLVRNLRNGFDPLVYNKKMVVEEGKSERKG